eukprot:14122323-Alexandrium_andersonii.AAC.1
MVADLHADSARGLRRALHAPCLCAPESVRSLCPVADVGMRETHKVRASDLAAQCSWARGRARLPGDPLRGSLSPLLTSRASLAHML